MTFVPEKPSTAGIGRATVRPTRAEAEEAVRTLILWAGDNPDREGLEDTPARVVRSYEEFFAGYDKDPENILRTTFEETEGYDEMVVLRDIEFHSHCEHHMVPFVGKVHIAYLPDKRVVGISKLARVVEVYARRLQIQEKLTAQIARTIEDVLKPRGVAVVVEAVRRYTRLPIAAHLMIDHPADYIEAFAQAGADIGAYALGGGQKNIGCRLGMRHGAGVGLLGAPVGLGGAVLVTCALLRRGHTWRVGLDRKPGA